MSHETLQLIWFLLIAVLWTGYLILEGFDFGVGMLLPFIPKGEKERRLAINTVGPHWDGNEVWLLTAGGATFAAFPEWYGTLFSGAYLALFVILLALIARIVSFEWRGKITAPRWKNAYYWGLVLGSWIPAVLWGVAFGNLVAGMKIQPLSGTTYPLQYTGNFFDLLTNGHGFALLSGVLTAVVFLAHGAIFLSLKTAGDLQARAAKAASRLSIVALVVGAVWAIWLQLAFSGKGWTWIPLVVAALGLASSAWFTLKRSEGWAFIASAVAILGAVALIFGALYPNVMPSNIDPAYSLTIHNASSSQYTLEMMSWVAVIFTPIVLAYQAWSYWVFRKRLHVDQIPDEVPVTFTLDPEKVDATR